jgi:hypothetical protein
LKENNQQLMEQIITLENDIQYHHQENANSKTEYPNLGKKLMCQQKLKNKKMNSTDQKRQDLTSPRKEEQGLVSEPKFQYQMNL